MGPLEGIAVKIPRSQRINQQFFFIVISFIEVLIEHSKNTTVKYT